MRPCARTVARGGRASTAVVVGQFDRRSVDGAERRQRLACRGQRRVDVPQHDGRAREQHAFGGGVADALRAAGDDGHAAVQVDLVHRASPFSASAAFGPALAVGDVLTDDVGEARCRASGRAPRRARRSRRCGQLATMPAMRSSRSKRTRARTAWPATASSASSISLTVTFSAGRFIARRPPKRLAAGLVDGDQRRRPCAPATTPGATPPATPGRSTPRRPAARG